MDLPSVSIAELSTKVPPSGERRGQRTERHVICKAPKGEPRLPFWRLANHMPFSSLTATLSARRDFSNVGRFLSPFV